MDVKLAGQMAEDAYDPAKLRAGWSFHGDLDIGYAQNGDFGAFRVYRNDLTHEVVFAFKGTNNLSEFRSDIADSGRTVIANALGRAQVVLEVFATIRCIRRSDLAFGHRLPSFPKDEVSMKAAQSHSLTSDEPSYRSMLAAGASMAMAKALRPIGFIVGFLLCPVVSFGGEYHLVAEKNYSGRAPVPTVNSLKATRDGGYMFFGSALTHEVWVVKTAPDGGREWETRIPGRLGSEQQAIFGLESVDGGHLVIGRGNPVEIRSAEGAKAAASRRDGSRGTHPFVMKLARNGELQWRRMLQSRDGATYIRPVCGASIAGGYIVVATKPKIYASRITSTGRTGVSHPLVMKIDDDGEVKWEVLIDEEEPGLLLDSGSVLGPKACGGPVVDERGLVTFSLTVRLRPSLSSAEGRIVDGPGTIDKSRFASLVIQIDTSARIQGRRVIEGGLRAFLFRADSGFLVLDQATPVSGSPVRRTWIATDLTVTKQQEASGPQGGLFGMEMALQDADGSFHVLGHYVTPSNRRGHTAIVRLHPNGNLTDLRAIDHWYLPSEGAVAIARGRDKGEGAMLLRRDGDIALMHFRFEE